MIIKDKIYGRFEITEPILIELLKSPAVLRLKKISQYGIPDQYCEFKNFSRYDHSFGVMLCLRKIGADLEEQIAGLIHDVSHLAFSHVADWVFAEGHQGKEDYHDSIRDLFIKNSGIPGILKKHGFNLERILDENNFKLLENRIPNVCADRFDYSIQEFYYNHNRSIVERCVNSLADYRGEMIFLSQKTALLFAKNFLNLQLQHWGSNSIATRYFDFSIILKKALQKSIIKQEDFFLDEDLIMSKLYASHDREIDERLKLLEKADYIQIRAKSNQKINKKFRYVDPRVLIDGKIKRVSELYPEFKKKIERERAKNQKGVLV